MCASSLVEQANTVLYFGTKVVVIRRVDPDEQGLLLRGRDSHATGPVQSTSRLNLFVNDYGERITWSSHSTSHHKVR